MGRRSPPPAVLFWIATIVLVSSQLAVVLDPLPQGLRATYYSTPDWSGSAVRSTVDRTPSTYSLFLAWRGLPPQSFSAAWTGWIAVLEEGDYTFATVSDDGSRVFVEGKLVVDNGGAHQAQLSAGSIHLARGVHPLVVTYFQSGGALELDLRWAKNGAPLESIPAWRLAPRPTSFRRFVASVIVRRIASAAIWLWLAATLCLTAVAIAHPFHRAWLKGSGEAIAAVEWTLLFAGAALLLFVLPHQITSDAWVRYFGLAKLIEWHELSTTYYSFVGPLFSAPLYLLGNVIASPQWWCERFNAFVFVAGLSVMWQLMRKHVTAQLFRKFALLLVAASMFGNGVQDYFGEVFTAVLAGAGLMAVEFGHPIAGWTAAIVGVANTPATIVGLATAAAVYAWKARRLRYVMPVALAAAAIMLEWWIRLSAPFDARYAGTTGNPTILTYSGRPGFSYPLFFGLLSVLFSFGKGLVFYAPGLILPIQRHLRSLSPRLAGTYALWLAFLAGIVLVYARWWAWFGGWAWGPRFFLFASIPASLALAVALERAEQSGPPFRLAVLGALTLSTWVAVDGVLFGISALETCMNDTFASLCWYVPEFSPLWRPFVQFTTPSVNRVIVGAYFAIVYAWLATPLVGWLAPAGVTLVERAWRELTRKPWHF